MAHEKLIFFDSFDELAKYLGITRDELWDLGVCGDDYDYFLVVEDKTSEEIPYLVKSDIGLLRGVCDTEQHDLNIKGKKYWVGATYHA